MNSRYALTFALAIASFSTASSALAQIPCNGYEVAHVIKAPPVGENSSPTIGRGISPDGHYVTGYYTPGSTGADRAFLFDTWTGELFLIPLGPGIQEAIGESVNNDGVVCGSGVHVEAGKRAFVYDSKKQTWTGLAADGAFGWSSANSVNASGVVCGFRSLNDGGSPVNPRGIYTWSEQRGFDDLGVLIGPSAEAMHITNSGVLCGWTGAIAIPSKTGSKGFVIDENGVTILPVIPGGISSALMAVNEHGLACGYGRFATPKGLVVVHALSWQDGEITDLGTLPGYLRSFALDVNEAGIVVGYSHEVRSGPNEKGTLWHNGEIVDVNTLFKPGKLTQARKVESISSNGALTGLGYDSKNDVVGFVLIPKPNVLGDIDGNCAINVDDLLEVINDWGHNESPADLDKSGVVGIGDLVIVIENWTVT